MAKMRSKLNATVKLSHKVPACTTPMCHLTLMKRVLFPALIETEKPGTGKFLSLGERCRTVVFKQ